MFEGQFWIVKDAFTARKFLEKVDELVEKHDRIEFQWITDKNRSALQIGPCTFTKHLNSLE